VLVTGGAGFIGSNWVRHLFSAHPDYEIVVVDALTYAGSVENLPADVQTVKDGRLAFWYGNISNANLIDSLVAHSDVVVHFPAEIHVTRSIYDNLQFFQTDVIGTCTLMNAVLKNLDRIERVIHISTSEVYGTAMSATMSESHPLNPMSPYASANCGADRLVHSYATTYALPVIIVRPFNNYGQRQHLEIPRFLTSVLLGEELTVHGDGSAARDFVHVDDTVRAIDLLMHAPIESVRGEVFNVASGQHRSTREIAIDVVRVMNGDPGKIVHIGDRPGQVLRHTGDSSKLQARFGWKPQVDWESGLRCTGEWYAEHRDWWSKQIWLRRIPIRTASGIIELH
jgi:dTDP-glucose 4,6-dehydratase